MNTLSRTLLATVALAACTAASATNVGKVTDATSTFGELAYQAGNYEDIYFTIGAPGVVTGTLYAPGISAPSLELFGDEGSHILSLVDLGGGKYSFTTGPLSESNYGLNFYGTSAGGVSGTLTTAVPEPEVAGMLALGLGVLGVAARRRKSA